MNKDDKFEKLESRKLFEKWTRRLEISQKSLVYSQNLIEINITQNNALIFEEAAIEFYNKIKDIVNNE